MKTEKAIKTSGVQKDEQRHALESTSYEGEGKTDRTSYDEIGVCSDEGSVETKGKACTDQVSVHEKPSFEEFFRQNEKRIHYHIHKLNIRDPQNEFYVEGLYAMWSAYKKYRPDQGVMSTYFNYTIRNRLIDMLRKKTRETHNEETYIQQQKPNLDNGNRDCRTNMPIPDKSGMEVTDDTFWRQVQAILTENQWKWVKLYIIEEMSLKEIAEQEGVTVEAVKSWRKTAKKRLKGAGVREWLC